MALYSSLVSFFSNNAFLIGIYLLTGILPYVVVLLEFKKDGWQIIKLYCHLYTFPLVVFPFLLYFIRKFSILLSTASLQIPSYYDVIILLFPVAGTLLDVGFGNRAIFEFRPSVIRSSRGKEGKPIDHFHTLLGLNSEYNTLCESIKKNMAPKGATKCAALEKKRNKLQDSFSAGLSGHPFFQTVSFSWLLYVISIYLFFLLVVFSYLCLMIALNSHTVFSGDAKTEALKTFTMAILLLSLWVPMRIYFLSEKKGLYKNITMIGELPITFLFIGTYIYLISMFFPDYNQIILNILGAIVTIGGPLLAFWSPQKLSKIFGLESSPASYVGLLLVLLLLLLPHL